MFIRFVTDKLDPDSERKQGVFHAAWALMNSGRLGKEDAAELDRLLSDFRGLRVPLRLSAYRDYRRRRARAICWFKTRAHKDVARMWRLVRFLKRHGIQIKVLKARHPGYVAYEDERQVAAEPFFETVLSERHA